MEWNDIVTLIGIFCGGAVAAYVGYFKKGPGAVSGKHAEVAGAIVDSGAVKELAAALLIHAKAVTDAREDHEKGRKLGYEMNETGADIARELGELRRAIGDLVREILRMK